MVALSALRSEIKDAINSAGIKAIDYVAESIVPPVVVVIPGSPYVSRPEGTVPFGTYLVTLQVLVLAGSGTNQTSAKRLDEMVTEVTNALDDWDLDEVSQPGQVSINGSNYLGTVITIETESKLEGAI